MTTSTKIFKSRDSATAALRKLGVPSADYTLYIEKHKDGFECFLDEAAQAMAGDGPDFGDIVSAQAKPKAVKQAKPVAAKVPSEFKVQTKLFDKKEDAVAYVKELGVQDKHIDKFLQRTESGRTLALVMDAVKFANNGNVTPATEKKDPVLTSAIAKAKAAHYANEPVSFAADRLEAALKKPKQNQERLVSPTSQAGFMRKMIVEGHTNEEVHAALVKYFKMDKAEAELKKGYPGWYRRTCVKAGLIAAPAAA